MIRTRDFLIFVVVVCFLLSAIGLTIVTDSAVLARNEMFVPTQSDSNGQVFVAEAPERTIDRPGIIARLREKIGDISSLAAVAETTEPTVEDTVVVSDTEPVRVTALRCPYVDNGQMTALSWPSSNIEIMTAEGARAVVANDGLIVRPLIQLPLSPAMSNSPACLDSEIIGVTPSGGLIFNTDAVLYANVPSTSLIGYARDGFPIYGAYSGSTDECGGYEIGGQYRYSLSADRNFLIGCFKATPQPFSI